MSLCASFASAPVTTNTMNWLFFLIVFLTSDLLSLGQGYRHNSDPNLRVKRKRPDFTDASLVANDGDDVQITAATAKSVLDDDPVTSVSTSPADGLTVATGRRGLDDESVTVAVTTTASPGDETTTNVGTTISDDDAGIAPPDADELAIDEDPDSESGVTATTPESQTTGAGAVGYDDTDSSSPASQTTSPPSDGSDIPESQEDGDESDSQDDASDGVTTDASSTVADASGQEEWDNRPDVGGDDDESDKPNAGDESSTEVTDVETTTAAEGAADDNEATGESIRVLHAFNYMRYDT